MKKLLLILVVTLMSIFTVSAKDEIGVPLEVDTVLVAEKFNADQIYSAIRAWASTQFPAAAINLDDAAGRHLAARVNVDFPVNNMTWAALSGCIYFNVDVQARDGRYRLRLTNFTHQSFDKRYGDSWNQGTVYVNGVPENRQGMKKKPYKEMQKRAVPLIIDTAASMIATLSEAVSHPAAEEDW